MTKQKNNLSYGVINSKIRALLLIISAFFFLGATAPGCIFSSLIPKNIPADGGVFKSADNGFTWSQKFSLANTGSNKNSDNIAVLNVLSLAIDPRDSNIVYAGTEKNGLFRSSDAAETWQKYNNAVLPNETIYDIAINPKDPKNIYLATATANSQGRVLKSDDEGNTWQEVYITSSARKDFIKKLKIDSYDPKVVYFGTNAGGLFRSADSGKSWSLLKWFSGSVDNIAINPKDTRIIYATGSGDGLFKSPDKGASWQSLSGGLKDFEIPSRNKIDALALDPANPNVIYLGSIVGILKSDNGAVSWRAAKIITPTKILPINSLIVNPSNPAKVYYSIGSQIYISGDGAETNWTVRNLPTSRNIPVILVDPKNENIIYAGSYALFK